MCNYYFFGDLKRNSSLEDNSTETQVLSKQWIIKGRYLKAVNGDNIIIDDKGTGPIVMKNYTGNDNIFEGLTDGDLISVSVDYILDSYPGVTSIYELKLLENGSKKKLDSKTVQELKNMDLYFM